MSALIHRRDFRITRFWVLSAGNINTHLERIKTVGFDHLWRGNETSYVRKTLCSRRSCGTHDKEPVPNYVHTMCSPDPRGSAELMLLAGCSSWPSSSIAWLCTVCSITNNGHKAADLCARNV